MDKDYYIKSFSKSQEQISYLIDEIMQCDDTDKLNSLLIELIAETKLHFFEKYNCSREGQCAVTKCQKGIDVERKGLQLIEKCLHEKKRTRQIQRIVLGWFRDNFWIIEAACLQCSNLGFNAIEQENLHDQHMARVKKFTGGDRQS